MVHGFRKTRVLRCNGRLKLVELNLLVRTAAAPECGFASDSGQKSPNSRGRIGATLGHVRQLVAKLLFRETKPIKSSEMHVRHIIEEHSELRKESAYGE